jgi:Flp pilus assembly protein CpaB
VVGLVLVCASVLVGARLLASADDTVPVLATRGALAAGQRVGADDLRVVRVRFADAGEADRYLRSDTDLAGSVLRRPLGPGELVPRAALAAGASSRLAELPLSVDRGRVPASVAAGSVVDVWVGPADGSGSHRGRLLVAGVPVLATSAQDSFGAGGARQVVVGVPAADHGRLAGVIGRLSQDAPVLLVRRR